MKVLLNDINKVKKFVDICSKSSENIDVTSGKFTVDGKSIMGVFSLNLSQPIEIHIYGEDKEFEKNIGELVI